MMTREESLEIIRRASGGNTPAGSETSQTVQDNTQQQNTSMRSREESLRILQSAMGGGSTQTQGAEIPPSVSLPLDSSPQGGTSGASPQSAAPTAPLTQGSLAGGGRSAVDGGVGRGGRTDIRADLQRQLNALDEAAAYVTTTEQSDAIEQQRRPIIEQLRQMDEEEGRTGVYTGGDRLKNLFSNARLATQQGLTKADHRIAQTADWLFGGIAKEGRALLNTTLQSINPNWGFENEDPLITQYNKRGEDVIAHNEAVAQKRIEEGRLSPTAWKYAPEVVAAIPDAVLAYLTAGASSGAQATSAGLEAASAAAQAGKAAQTIVPIANATKNMIKNPAWASAFAQTAGSSYEQALAEGATEDEANLYALLNGFANATIEVGGSDEALGGIQKLPKQLRDALEKGNNTAVMRWIKSTANEAVEEVAQGMAEKAMRGIYTNDVPLYSATDENAVINPTRAKEEALGGFVVGGLLGGGQSLIQAAINENRQSARSAQTAGQEQPGAEAQAAEQAENSTAQTQEKSYPTVEELIQPIRPAGNAEAEAFSPATGGNAPVNAGVQATAQGQTTGQQVMTREERAQKEADWWANREKEAEKAYEDAKKRYEESLSSGNADEFDFLSSPEIRKTLMDMAEKDLEDVRNRKIPSPFSNAEAQAAGTAVAEETPQPATPTAPLAEEPLRAATQSRPYSQPEQVPELNTRQETQAQAAETADRLPKAELYNMRAGKNGWDKSYGTAMEALNDAVQYVDPGLWDAIKSESRDSNENIKYGTFPMVGALTAVQEEVRGEQITPMQGAKLLSEIYQQGGAEALKTIYNPRTGNLYDKYIGQAKQYVFQKAAGTPQEAQRATPQAETPPTTANAAQAASDALNRQEGTTAQGQVMTDTESETRFNELAEKYGAIPTGEAPAREVQVPQRISKEKAVGRTARTIMEAEATPDKRLGSVREAVLDGKFSYTEISNRELADSAAQRIQDDGWQKSLNDWTAAVRQNQANENLAAMGAQLLNNAGNSDMSAEQYIDLATDYNRLMHNLGRGLAAARILKTLTPEGKLYGIQRSIQSMVDEANGKYKVEIDPALIDEYRAQTTDEGRDAVISKMQQNIADQIPSTWMDKFTALRYTNMLGNFKTQIRNVGGNVLMTLTRTVKDKLAAVIENAAYAASGGKIERTKSLWAGKALYGEAMRDFLNVEKEAMGESKFSDSGRAFGREVQEKRTIFKVNGKWGTSEAETGFGRSAVAKAARKTSDLGMAAMETKRKVTNWAMEQGDRIFVRINYADALAGWLNAHGISSIANASTDTLDRARQYAIKQAQEATFRDTNSVSQFVSTFDKGWGETGFGKVAQKVTQGIAPFRKTPANVAVRAEEYSPLGILNTAYKVFEAKQGKNDVTWADVIDSAAKTLTGSGIFALGYLMSAAGSARGKEDDEKKAAFEDMQGLQEYSIVLPNGKTVSLDWAAPDSIPFFMGVLTQEAVADGGLSWDDAGKIIGAVSDPMLEMSMLSGLNDALDNISRYNGDADALPQFLMNSFASYLSQGLTDSLLGQVERASQETRQTTYTDPESKIPSSLQYILGKASAKTPGLDYNQQDYIDAWGRKQSTGTVGERIINNFINPAYVSEDRSTPVDDELKRLYDAGQTNVFPQKAARSTQINGVRLSPEEYEAYSITKGQQSLTLVQDFIESDAYKDMGDDARAKIISDLYSFAASRAAKEIADGRKESYTSKWDDEAKLSDVVGYLTSKSQLKAAQESKDYTLLDTLIDTVTEQKADVRGKLYKDFSMLDELIYGKQRGVDAKTIYTAKTEADTNGNGKISQEELWYYLGIQKNMPTTTKSVLWDILTTGETGYAQYAEKQK